MNVKHSYEVTVGDTVGQLGDVVFNRPLTVTRTSEYKGRTTVIYWDNGGFFPTHGNDPRIAHLV